MPPSTARAPAVAVMAKAPLPGQVKSRLCPPLTAVQAADLARDFLLDALDKLRGVTGIARYLAYSPREAEAMARQLAGAGITCLPQEGGDLGRRMDRLARRLLQDGHPAVVLAGTDTPTLPAAVLGDAVARLAGGQADLVLGPAEDGGYYLIGMRRPHPELFTGIAWGGPTVLEETRRRARQHRLRLRLLPPCPDVDTPEDLARLLAAPPPDAPGTAHTRRCLDALFPTPDALSRAE